MRGGRLPAYLHEFVSSIDLTTGVNFTAYQLFKKWAMEYQPQYGGEKGQLPSWQTMVLGLVSGAMGPFSNAPIDTIKT